MTGKAFKKLKHPDLCDTNLYLFIYFFILIVISSPKTKSHPYFSKDYYLSKHLHKTDSG